MAWRELLLRQRINSAAKANLLLFANGSDLDHLAAFYDVTRMKGEEDEQFRKRICLKIQSWSRTGTAAHYSYHAMAADSRVRCAKATTTEKPGGVRVALSEEGGSASEDLCTTVARYLNRDDVKMLTDTIEVVSVKTVPIAIEATIQANVPLNKKVLRNEFIAKFNENNEMGRSVHRSWIIGTLFTEGVTQVALHRPEKDVLIRDDPLPILKEVSLL